MRRTGREEGGGRGREGVREGYTGVHALEVSGVWTAVPLQQL
jgi:hypothetical protein